ncbi:MAG: hypothetical protein AMXMBFR83_16250 [Phycisphaerae bacterium]
MSTARAETIPLTRDQLLGLAARAESYPFLALALAAMPRLAEDGELRLQVVRHYAQLGLIRPALAEIRALPAALRAQLEANGVCAQLAGLPDGRVPWERLFGRFEANRHVLLARQPELSESLEAGLRGLRALELYSCRDGNYQLCAFNDRDERVWLPRLMDHRGESGRLAVPREANAALGSPVLLEGLNLGWFLPRLMAETAKLFLNYSAAVYVIEPNPLVLAAVLHLHDWRELLAEERVRFFVGPDAFERFKALLLEREDLPLPLRYVRMASWGAGPGGDAESIVQALARHRAQRTEQMKREVEAIYRGRDMAFWARRYATAGEGEPLRVLLPVSRYTTYLKYCMRDLAEAFERRGMVTRVLMEPTDHSVLPPAAYGQAVRDFRPDLVLIIDHFRREYGGMIPESLPFVGWIQDQLPNLYASECGRSLGRFDFFVTTDPSLFVHRYGYPASQGLAWTLATDDRTYGHAPLSDAELAPYRCDFSYASNQSAPPERFHEERKRQTAGDAGVAALMDRLFEELKAGFQADAVTARMSVQWLLERIEDREGPVGLTPEARESLLRFYLDPLAELMFRQSTLAWVADYCDRTGRTLHLYGRGWEQHPRFSRYARGVAANGPELRAVYQASRINLQIIGTGAIHQRMLDGLAAGGFFLIRRTPPDFAHPAVGAYLAAWRKYGAAADGAGADQVPELYEALRGLHALMGHDLRPERFKADPATTAFYEQIEAGGFQRVAGAVFSAYEQVAFGSPAELAKLADRYLADPQARARVAEDMRRVVVSRYTYGSFVDALLAFLRRRLEQMAGGPTAPAGASESGPEAREVAHVLS